MIDFSKFKDGIPFSAFMNTKKTKTKKTKTKKTKKKSRSPSRKRRRTRRTKKKPIRIPPKGVIIRKKDKLYRSNGKSLVAINQ